MEFPTCMWDQRALLGSLTPPRWCSRSTFGFCFRSSWDTLLPTAVCCVLCPAPDRASHLDSCQTQSVATALILKVVMCSSSCLPCHWEGCRTEVEGKAFMPQWRGAAVLHQEASNRVQKAWGVKVKNGQRIKRRVKRGKILLGELSQPCALSDH